jgi:predicted transcriptional regulator
MPLDGFTPESLDILCKLVASKEPLIKKALGADALPIKVLSDKVAFPWFKTADSGELNAYAQFITALCDTAKMKTRVVAKPQSAYDNEKFSMRIFGIQLGLKGEEYSLCRKLLLKNLTGDSGYRFGKPEDGAPTKKRDGIQREVVSIRLTPETLEKLSILASQAETETGQRTSRNMLIEQAVEAYVEQAVLEAACLPEAASDALNLANNASVETPTDEAPAITLPEENAPDVVEAVAEERDDK